VSVALLIPHAKRMDRIIRSSVTRLVLLYFSAFSHKARCSKNLFEHKMCVLTFFTTFSETFLNLRRNEPDMIKMHICHRVKYPFFLSDLHEF